MKNRIFGVIGVLWGGGLVVSNFLHGVQGEGAYASGQKTAVIFGGLMFCVGLYYLVKGGKKAEAQEK